MPLPLTNPKSNQIKKFHRGSAVFFTYAFRALTGTVDITGSSFFLQIDGFANNPYPMTVQGNVISVVVPMTEADLIDRGCYHFHVYHNTPTTENSIAIAGTVELIE